jgi:hypothetical protein
VSVAATGPSMAPGCRPGLWACLREQPSMAGRTGTANRHTVGRDPHATSPRTSTIFRWEHQETKENLRSHRLGKSAEGAGDAVRHSFSSCKQIEAMDKENWESSLPKIRDRSEVALTCLTPRSYFQPERGATYNPGKVPQAV